MAEGWLESIMKSKPKMEIRRVEVGFRHTTGDVEAQ